MDVAETQFVFADSQLDLVGVDIEPRYQGTYKSSNVLINALAHLVGSDGTYSRLVGVDTAGRLQVTGGIDQTQYNQLHADLGELLSRLNTANSNWGSALIYLAGMDTNMAQLNNLMHNMSAGFSGDDKLRVQVIAS
jgi:hypothetical protein